MTGTRFRPRALPREGCSRNGQPGREVTATSQGSQFADHPPGLDTTLLKSSGADRLSRVLSRSLIISRHRMSPAVAAAPPRPLLRTIVPYPDCVADGPV